MNMKRRLRSLVPRVAVAVVAVAVVAVAVVAGPAAWGRASAPGGAGAPDEGGSVTILASGGAGVYRQRASLEVGHYPYALVAADFDGDGVLGLACTNFGSGTVSILRGARGGTLRAARVLAVGDQPDAVVAAVPAGPRPTALVPVPVNSPPGTWLAVADAGAPDEGP